MKSYFIPIKKFHDEPYSKIIGFPNGTKNQIKKRIIELEKLKVKSISFSGKTTIGKLSILGKGYVGVVVLARKDSKKIALKIRRIDSQRNNMKNEELFLKSVNKINVGPKVFGSSKNFLLMEYIDGIKILDWITQLNGRGSSKKLKIVIKKILEDCFALDKMGFDHGELSDISKHVLIEDNIPYIIDFESGSLKRRTSNVTSVTQAIFIGSGISKQVQKIYKNPTKNEIINALKIYKNCKNRENFEKVLKVLKL